MSKENIRIGVIMVTLVDAYQQHIYAGIQRAAGFYNINLLCIEDKHPEDYLTRKNSIAEQIKKSDLDGVIVFTAVIEILMGENATYNYLKSLGNIPVICIGSQMDGFPSLITDNESGVRNLMDHLIVDHNCRKIANIAGPQQNTEAKIRFETYKNMLEKHNIDFDDNLVFFGNFEPGDGVIGLRCLLDDRNAVFDALICVDDHCALEVMDELNKRGIPIPDDLIIAGFDDIENSEFSKPGLTTVRQPLFEMGFKSLKYAINSISGKNVPLLTAVNSQLLLRGSCNCSSIRYFHDQNDTFCVEDISDEALINTIENTINDKTYTKLLDKDEIELHADSVAYLLDTCISFIKGHEETTLWRIIQDFIDNSYESGKNGLYWIRTLYPYFHELGSSIAVVSLWNRLSAYILLADHNNKGRAKLQEYNLQLQLAGLLKFVVSGSSRQKLIEQLNFSLPRLGIGDLQLSLLDDNENVNVLILYKNGIFIEPENTLLPAGQLFCDELKENTNKSFYMIPLYAQKKALGYLTVEAGKLSTNFYHELTQKITHGIEGMLMMEKINLYTGHLEDEIRKRTQELNKANEQLRHLSYIDHLSNLRNRRFLNDIIQPEAERFAKRCRYNWKGIDKRDRSAIPVFGLFMIDLDHFKRVNDEYGHESGDMVIKQLSHLFVEECREDDFVVRMGGEEFLLVLRNFDTHFMLEKGNRIRNRIKNHQFTIAGNITIQKTCSIGCIAYPSIAHPELITSLSTAVALADKALYYAKENGRDKAVSIKFTENVDQLELEKFINNPDNQSTSILFVE